MHHEQFRPNNIWMYWLMNERVLPPAWEKTVERRIKGIANTILTYALTQKGVANSPGQLGDFLRATLRNNKPAFLPDTILEPGSRLWSVMESQIRTFRRNRLRQQTKKLLKSAWREVRQRLPGDPGAG